jgi:PAS domain S-box-containing protein
MPRQKTLLIIGALIALISASAALLYRQTLQETPAIVFALFVSTIVGTGIAMTAIFYARLEQSTESSRFSKKLLEDSEARFRHLFDISPFPAVLTAIEDHRVLAVNERTAERFGLHRDAAAGLYAPDFYVDPEQRARLVEQLRQTGQAEGLLVQLKTPSGEQFWAEVYARIVKFEGRSATMSVFHDARQ